MRKKIRFSLLVFLFLFNIVGCSGGSYTITIGEIDSKKDHISGEYNRFSGHYFKKVTLDSDQKLSLNFLAETMSGELIAKVIDSDGDTIRTLKPGNTTTLDQPDQYKMQVEGEKHQGSFKLS
ncbi:hypothetical protein [Niallia sp. Krafla_26]|uniref:hypothetical protein n=1 Tax=Niallia sp. Krafla_26 TaxID=3064703 RepID=UPI003D169F1C